MPAPRIASRPGASPWNMVDARPLFGHGVRTSSQYTHTYGADEEGLVILSTHLQLVADSGLVADLIFLGGSFYCGARTYNRTNRIHQGIARRSQHRSHTRPETG